MRFREFNQDKDIKPALINVLSNMKGDADEKDKATEISMERLMAALRVNPIKYPSSA